MKCRLIPRTSKINLILIAGLVWLAAGINILRIGVLADFSVSVWIIILAVLTFGLFGKMFYKIVGRHSMRILNMAEDKINVFRFFDAKSYVMMAIMMTSGILGRNLGIFPLWFIKGFYSGLGSALSLSGVLFVADFGRCKSGRPPEGERTGAGRKAGKTFNTLLLPENYVEIAKIDLLNNRRQLLAVNGLALLIAAVMLAVGLALVPVKLTFADGGFWRLLFKTGIFIAGVVLYTVLHELVHGVFIKKFSGRKAKYGFGMGYAYAGSEAYFKKRSYIVIALAPIIILGAGLAVLNFRFTGWFWVIYGLQMLNVSGAAGDFYVTYRMLKFPPDILVQDSGTEMTVYAPKKPEL